MATSLDPANVAAAAAHIVNIKGPTIALGDGSYFDFLDPSATTMTIEDYAYALAYTVRFRGQTKHRGERCFYGVGQHCVQLACALIDDGYDAVTAFAGLMHESDEMPLGDMPGPVKPLLGDYKALAKVCGYAIDQHFRVATPDADLIKRYDIRMLATEKRDLMPRHGDHEWHNGGSGVASLVGYEPFDFEIMPSPHPTMAAEAFLDLYHDLRSQIDAA
jgi:hypothetical protein